MKSVAKSEAGFTLIELLTVVGLIGILGVIAIPQYNSYRLRARVAVVAAELRNFSSGFLAYMLANQDFPPDSHLVLPAGMEKYIPAGAWSEVTPIGGRYNWEGPSNYPYAGISISEAVIGSEEIRLLDNLMDDGNTASGKFRVMGNGRPTYVIEE